MNDPKGRIWQSQIIISQERNPPLIARETCIGQTTFSFSKSVFDINDVTVVDCDAIVLKSNVNDVIVVDCDVIVLKSNVSDVIVVGASKDRWVTSYGRFTCQLPSLSQCPSRGNQSNQDFTKWSLSENANFLIIWFFTVKSILNKTDLSKIFANMVVLLILISVPWIRNLGAQLRNWRLGNFKRLYLKTIILEPQNSKKYVRNCVHRLV